jgi:chemotaxis family two-component system response regulator Rcp1
MTVPKPSSPRAPVNILIAHPDEDVMLRLQLALRAITTPAALYHVKDETSLFSFLRKAPPYETAQRPDIILLGYTLMPALGRLKSDNPFSPIPVIIMATDITREQSRQAHARHANACMRIPSDTAGMRSFAAALDGFWFRTALLPVNQDV